MSSDLEVAVVSLVGLFHSYAHKDGDFETLSQKEAKELITEQMSHFLEAQRDPAAVDKIMADMDLDGDAKLNFLEFMIKVIELACACQCCSQEVSQSQDTSGPKTQLEAIVMSLRGLFHSYAHRDGDCDTLSRKEAKELLTEQLSHFLEAQRDPAAVDKLMEGLDLDDDGKIDFHEFMILVLSLSFACQCCFQELLSPANE